MKDPRGVAEFDYQVTRTELRGLLGEATYFLIALHGISSSYYMSFEVASRAVMIRQIFHPEMQAYIERASAISSQSLTVGVMAFDGVPYRSAEGLLEADVPVGTSHEVIFAGCYYPDDAGLKLVHLAVSLDRNALHQASGPSVAETA